jgi:ankyrin repeat protein
MMHKVNALLNKNTPPEKLLLAAQNGDVARVKKQLGYGASPDSRDKDGATALHLGAGFPEVIAVLIAENADLNWQDVDGFTPLHSAVLAKNTESLRLLLETGRANPLLKDNNQITPLTMARSSKEIDPSGIMQAQLEKAERDWQEKLAKEQQF